MKLASSRHAGRVTPESSAHSDAISDSDFGADFVFSNASVSSSGHGRAGADVYDIDYLRAKNKELKNELRILQNEYDELQQYGNRGMVSHRTTELVYKSLPAIPYTIKWHYSPRGLEFTQVYFWMIRDALWMQQKGDAAAGMGGFCLALAGILVIIAGYSHRQTLTTTAELFHAISRLLWMVGMYVWMLYAVYDLDGNAAGDIYTPKGGPGRFIGTCCLVVAFIISFGICAARFVAWKVVLIPDECVPVVQAVQMKPHEEPRLRAKFYYLFASFRDWEYAALLLWVGKDLAAAQQVPIWWCFFYIVIYCVTVFTLVVSLNTKKALIDHLHYVCIASWLLGNFIFQLSHMFLKDYRTNSWEYMYPRHQSSEYVGNYFATIFVLLGFIPVFVLYAVWITATALNKIKVDPEEVVAWDVPTAELVSIIFIVFAFFILFLFFWSTALYTNPFLSRPSLPLTFTHTTRTHNSSGRLR